MSARVFARRHRRWGPILVLAACFAHNLWASWLKWGDPVADTGREMHTAYRIAGGATLYADLRWWYGPFAPYFNGLLVKLFGPSYYVFCAAGCATAVLMCVMLYRLARRFMDRTSATFVSAAFLYLCGFAHLILYSTFNFILPYSFAATYGMCFAAASLLFLVRHARKCRGADLALSLAAMVLSAFCRAETFFPAFLAHAVFLVFAFFDKNRLTRAHLAGYAASVAVVLAGYGAIAAQVGYTTLVEDNLTGALNPRMMAYIANVAGTDNLPKSLEYVFASLVAGAVLGLLAWKAGGAASPNGGHVGSREFRAAALVAAGALLYWALATEIPFRALPFAAGVLFVLAARRRSPEPEGRNKRLAVLVLLAFAMGASARTPLRTVAYHYGFYLLPVGLVAFAWGFCAWLPRVREGAPRTLARCAGWGALLGAIVSHAMPSHFAYAAHTVAYDGPRGRILLLESFHRRPLGDSLKKTMELLERLPPGTRVLAVPQGQAMVYLAGLDNPYALSMYLPMDWSGSWNDEKIIAMWAAHPPDVVLRLNHGVEHGRFGIDYAQAPWAWLREHVEPYAVAGPNDGPPVVEIYRRPGVWFGEGGR